MTITDADKTAIVTRHLQAFTSMLLGTAVTKPALAMIGGAPLDVFGRMELGRMAVTSDCDLIHLEFDETPAGFALTGINLALPREPACHFYTECRLFLAAGASRAVILPREGGRGHFSVLPDEIGHIDRKPRGLTSEGVRRADRRLRALLKKGADVTGQVILQEWPIAA